MKLKEFSFRNICSYGELLQTVTLNDEPELILITGDNGAGKTTIANALTFALYGKSTKRKLSRLANRYNKNGYTEVKFTSSTGNKVNVFRGLSPNSFNVKVNDIAKNVAGKGNIDKMMDEQLIGIPFEIFSNNILLSINDFKSMVNMKPDDKRKIVDRIFDMYIVNDMHKILKKDVSDANDELSSFEYSVTTQNDVLAQNEARLTLLVEENKKANTERRVEIDAEIKTIEDNNAKLEKSRGEYEIKIVNIVNDINDYIAANAVAYDAIAEKHQINTKFDEKAATAKYTDEEEKRVELTSIANTFKDKTKALAAKMKEMSDTLDKDEEKTKGVILMTFSESLDAHTEKVKGVNDHFTNVVAKQGNLMKKTQEDIQSLHDDDVKLTNKIDNLNQKIEAYQNDICPTCDSDLQDVKHKENLAEYQGILKITQGDKDNNIGLTANAEALLGAQELELAKLLEDKAKQIQELNQELTTIQTVKNEGINIITEDYKQKRTTLSAKQLEATNKLHGWGMAKNKEINERYDKIFKGIDAGLSVKKQIEITRVDEEYTKLENARVKKVDAYKETRDADKLKYTTAKVTAENDMANNGTKISDLEFEKASISEDKSEAINSLRETIDGIKDKIDDINRNKNEVEYKISTYNIVGSLFGDSGLKQIMFDTIVPIFNASISQLVKDFSFRFDFGFDNKFEPYIFENGMDVEYEDMSSGEKKEMDLIVVLAVLELIKKKHPNMNLLFLDEIFNSLSPKNINKVVGILRNYMQRYNMTIFVISHTPVPLDLFDKVIEVFKENYFSTLTVK